MALPAYPFSAIVGQERLKKALILNLINPRIGGVLISGQKGTAKSTAVRALGSLTNKRVLTLPLSITEDRLVGSVDLEKTMRSGKNEFLPGLLYEADGHILYVDEVNLLQDHITDMVLTVQAEGMNRVEREGLSYEHPSRFLLVGTMNPEEGQLRQHFLDRFGLCVVVGSENTPESRVKIVKSMLSFDSDPVAFARQFRAEDEALKAHLQAAADLLPAIDLTEENHLTIVKLCVEAGVQGHRADLILGETAKAVAAWELRSSVTQEDIEQAAKFVLLHRRQTVPPQPEEQEQQEHRPQNENDPPDQSQDRDRDSDGSSSRSSRQGSGKEQTFAVGASFKVKDFGHDRSRQTHKGFGKRTSARSASKMGRYIASSQQRKNDDLALDATIRAAAPYQLLRDKGNLSIAIRESDIREKVRQRKYSNLLVFVVDASGSMGASQRMQETKGAILSLLKDAYIKRDKVCLIAFRGNEAQVLLPPTRSVDRGVKLLEEMRVGGKTPLNAGLSKAMTVILSELRKAPEILPYMIVITDGKGNVPLQERAKPKQELMEIAGKLREFKKINTMVLDIERKGAMSFGIAKQMAQTMGAKYQKVESLKSGAIVDAVERLR